MAERPRPPAAKRTRPRPHRSSNIHKFDAFRYQLGRLVIACLRGDLNEPRLADSLAEAIRESDELPERIQLVAEVRSGNWDAAKHLLDDIAAELSPISPWDEAQHRLAIYTLEKQRITELIAGKGAIAAAKYLRTAPHGLPADDVAELAQLLVRPVQQTDWHTFRIKIATRLISLLPVGSVVSSRRLRVLLSAARGLRDLRHNGHTRELRIIGDSALRRFCQDSFAVLNFPGSPDFLPSTLQPPLASINAALLKGDVCAALDALIAAPDSAFTTSREMALYALLGSIASDMSQLALIRKYSHLLPSGAVAELVKSGLSGECKQNKWQRHLRTQTPVRRVKSLLRAGALWETLVDPYAQQPSRQFLEAPNWRRTAWNFPAQCIHAESLGAPVWGAEFGLGGTRLAVITSDEHQLLIMFSVNRNKFPPCRRLWECDSKVGNESTGTAEAIAWHPTLPWLAVGTAETEGWLFHADSNQAVQRFSPEKLMAADEKGVGAFAFLPSNEGEPLRLLCGWLNGVFEIVEFKDDGSSYHTVWCHDYPLRVRSLSLADDQVYVLSAQAETAQQLMRLDISTFEVRKQTFKLLGDGQVSTIAASTFTMPDTLAIMSSVGLLMAGPGSPIFMDGPTQEAFVVPVRFTGLADKFLVVGTETQTPAATFIFNRYSGSLVAVLRGHKAMVNTVAWSEPFLVSGSDDEMMRFYAGAEYKSRIHTLIPA